MTNFFARILSARHAAVAILSLLVSTAFVSGQTPPAGNDHPHDEAHAELMTNPMADPNPGMNPAIPSDEKHAFAEQLDLDPLRVLPVLTNSRVGVLDTLARDSIMVITGKRSYTDFMPRTSESGKVSVDKLHYDPLFTILDMMADPSYYMNKPLLHVELLPFRQGILEAQFPDDPKRRERWMKLTRISPMILMTQAQTIQMDYGSDSFYTEGVGKLAMAWSAFNTLDTKMNIVAPVPGTGDWGHFSSDPEIAHKFSQLGTAWRSRNATEANTLIADIAGALIAIHPETQPAVWRSKLEVLYNGGRKLIAGYTLYFFALVSLLIAFGTGRVTMRRLGVTLLLTALAIHAAGFVVRWILAERIPIQNQFESMLGLCLGACLFGTIMMFVRKQPIFGAAAAGVGFLTLMTATMAGIPGEAIGREAAILNTSYILFYHVNIVLFSYGMIALGMIVSLAYLIMHYFAGKSEAAVQLAAASVGTGRGGGGETPGRARLLNDLDHAQMVILQLAFWILGIGILLGAWWADHSWGRWWAFDPKETWALLTWIVYLIVIHVRFGAKDRGLTTSWLSLAGFLTMLWTYFGVNLLLPGLHAYA